MSEISIVGYHGTNLANLTSILNNNFNPSEGDLQWLGTGAYFFTEGYPNDRSGEIAAGKWVTASSWNKSLKQNEFNSCCVIEAIIKIQERSFLDLTTSDGMQIFNYYRKKFVENLKKDGFKIKQTSTSPIFRDGELINQLRRIHGLEIDAVKGHFYFKYTEERILHADFRLPNCTVISVYNPKNNIHKSNIKLVSKFTIT
jgi:hypothetical protein